MKFRLIFLIPCLLLLALPAFPAEGTFDSDGVQIRYVEKGEGEPVVLIHGFIASAETNWIAPGIFDKLAQDFRVIALDNRGHGKSGKPHGVEHYGEKMVQDVVNLLDHLEIEKAHVAGYSMGGFMTLHMIVNHPDRLLSAAVCGAGWMPAEGLRADLNEEIAKSLESGNGITPLMEALTPAGQPKPDKAQLEAMNAAIMTTNDPIALASVIRAMGGLTPTAEQLRANEVPVFAIVGEIDPLREATGAMAGALHGLKRVSFVPGADHITAIANPQLAAELRAFFMEHASAGATTD